MTKKIVFALMFVCCMAFAGVSLAATASDVKEMEIKANKGDAVAQYNLGLAYALGDGVRQDYDIAIKWFEKAAAQGDAEAQFNIGVLYANGGVDFEQNDTLAKEWLKRACDNGYQDGCDAYNSLTK